MIFLFFFILIQTIGIYIGYDFPPLQVITVSFTAEMFFQLYMFMNDDDDDPTGTA